MPDNKPKFIITITVTENGNISIHGFPDEFQPAMSIMHNAAVTVAKHFVDKAKNDKVVIVPMASLN